MSSIHLNIDLTVQQLIDAIRQLEPAEKMRINEVLWEDLSIPTEHQEVVTDRKQASLKHPEKMLDWEYAKSKLRP